MNSIILFIITFRRQRCRSNNTSVNSTHLPLPCRDNMNMSVCGDVLLQGLKLRKYFRGQVGPYQINFGSPYNLLGSQQARIATSLARCPTAGGSGSPGINGVESCILAISWQQNWPFINYNLIQKIKNFQNISLKINLFYMHQYTDFRNL